MFIIGVLAVFTAMRYFWRLYRPVENAGLARAVLGSCADALTALWGGWDWPALPVSSH